MLQTRWLCCGLGPARCRCHRAALPRAVIFLSVRDTVTAEVRGTALQQGVRTSAIFHSPSGQAWDANCRRPQPAIMPGMSFLPPQRSSLGFSRQHACELLPTWPLIKRIFIWWVGKFQLRPVHSAWRFNNKVRKATKPVRGCRKVDRAQILSNASQPFLDCLNFAPC